MPSHRHNSLPKIGQAYSETTAAAPRRSRGASNAASVALAKAGRTVAVAKGLVAAATSGANRGANRVMPLPPVAPSRDLTLPPASAPSASSRSPPRLRSAALVAQAVKHRPRPSAFKTSGRNIAFIRLVYEDARRRHYARSAVRDAMERRPIDILREACEDIRAAVRLRLLSCHSLRGMEEDAEAEANRKARLAARLRRFRAGGRMCVMMQQIHKAEEHTDDMWRQLCDSLGTASKSLALSWALPGGIPEGCSSQGSLLFGCGSEGLKSGDLIVHRRRRTKAAAPPQ